MEIDSNIVNSLTLLILSELYVVYLGFAIPKNKVDIIFAETIHEDTKLMSLIIFITD